MSRAAVTRMHAGLGDVGRWHDAGQVTGAATAGLAAAFPAASAPGACMALNGSQRARRRDP